VENLEGGLGLQRVGQAAAGAHQSDQGGGNPVQKTKFHDVLLSVGLLQLVTQLVEQLGAARLALLGLLGAVEELPLLGVDEAGAVAGRESSTLASDAEMRLPPTVIA
jgi:hypothetical protein